MTKSVISMMKLVDQVSQSMSPSSVELLYTCSRHRYRMWLTYLTSLAAVTVHTRARESTDEVLTDAILAGVSSAVVNHCTTTQHDMLYVTLCCTFHDGTPVIQINVTLAACIVWSKQFTCCTVLIEGRKNGRRFQLALQKVTHYRACILLTVPLREVRSLFMENMTHVKTDGQVSFDLDKYHVPSDCTPQVHHMIRISQE